MKEKYRFFNAVLSSTLPVLYRRPKFFEILFSITVICSFQVRCSSINTPKYLIEVIRFISLSFINNDGSFKGILSFSRALWKNVYLVLSLFRDNLFALNHLKSSFSSKLAIWKSSFMHLCKKKRFGSSANIMGSNILDTLQNHLHILGKEVALRLILEALHGLYQD